MYRKEENHNHPYTSSQIRMLNGHAYGVRTIAALFGKKGNIFPFAYEEKEYGSGDDVSAPFSSYAHYHPLASCRQVRVDFVSRGGDKINWRPEARFQGMDWVASLQ